MKIKAIKYEFYELDDRPGVSMSMHIDLHSLQEATPQLILEAITSGLKEFIANTPVVSNKLFDACFDGSQEEIKKEVVRRITDELFNNVMKKIDIDVIAKLASIHAAKKMGEIVNDYSHARDASQIRQG